MNELYCIYCGKQILEGRVKALPNVETCVEHSDVEKKRGFRIISGKTTYTELEIVNESRFKILDQFSRKGFHANATAPGKHDLSLGNLK